MSGHRAFDELRQSIPTERRRKNAEATQTVLTDMALSELREARARSQADLARDMKVGEPEVAKLERRTDLYVSSLRRFVEALGGELEITARFPDGSVTITSFADIEQAESPK